MSWPHMTLLHGAATKIASFLEIMYKDEQLERAAWDVAHASGSRLRFAAQLHQKGDLVIKLGIGARTKEVLDHLEGTAKKLGIPYTSIRTDVGRVS